MQEKLSNDLSRPSERHHANAACTLQDSIKLMPTVFMQPRRKLETNARSRPLSQRQLARVFLLREKLAALPQIMPICGAASTRISQFTPCYL
jgi:hypothetical protein